MKLRIATLALCSFLTCSVGFADSTAPAASNPGKAVLLSSILKELQGYGYISIKEIKLEDNVYKIDAFDLGGEEVNLEVDATTGKILNRPDNSNNLTPEQAVSILEQAGYIKIESMQTDTNGYDVTVINKNGEEVDLEVSRGNGVISED